MQDFLLLLSRFVGQPPNTALPLHSSMPQPLHNMQEADHRMQGLAVVLSDKGQDGDSVEVEQQSKEI